MTRKTNLKFMTTRHILTIVLALLMCCSLFLASACSNEDSTTETIPEFSYTENTNSEIKNTSFTLDTSNMKYENFPKTTVEGWNLSRDSSAKSGVIDVSDKGWESLMSNLVKDSGLLSYVRHVNGNFTDADIKNKIREEAGDDTLEPTNSEIREYIVNNYLIYPDQPDASITYPFINPGKHKNDLDNKIYMLNNYNSSSLGFGGVQKITSSTELTLKPGEYAKVSAWVKTANLNLENSSNGYSDVDGPIGASISIKNTFNSNAQSEFGIYNITNTDWQEYHFYIKADQVYETKFTVILGLGYDNYAAEGTAYFDDLDVQLLDKDEYNALIATETTSLKTYKLDYGNKENDNNKVQSSLYSNNYHLYDMTVNINEQSGLVNDVSFHNDTTDDNYYSFTQYEDNNTNGNPTGQLNADNIASIENNLTNLPYGLSSGIKVSLTKPASFTIKLDNNGTDFTLENETYASITFFVKNQLSKLYATNIIINVQDIYEGTTTTRPAVATISETSDEWVKYTINVRNNFDKDNTNYKTRKFNLEIVVGPDDYQDEIDNYSLGTVYISKPIVATGVTYQYVDKSNKVETPYYQFYNLFSSTSVGSTALYTGFNQDYSDSTVQTEYYNISTSPSDIGAIVNRPATPKDYKGIEANHFYITGDTDDSVAVNTNNSSGVINTKYLSNYSTEIQNALNYTDTKNNIQPLMIKTEGKSYGYISNSYNIDSNGFAQISVKVRTYNATAYIYLVDVTNTEKTVMKFNAFTVNTEDGLYNNKGAQIPEKELFLKVDSSTMNGNDWITVNFYIATGVTAKSIRLELWNGGRDDTSTLSSNGYVFFDEINFNSSSEAFYEPLRWEDAISGSDSPLSQGEFEEFKLLAYKQELNAKEIEYNNDESKDYDISYPSKYIYAETSTMIYAIYNTLDPIVYDPYEYDTDEEETTTTDTTTETDPATFWLSFSTILLGVALILAIIMLFIKRIRYRRRAYQDDAKSHYVVRSRINSSKTDTKKKGSKEVDVDLTEENDVNEIIEDSIEQQNESDEELTLDDYVYGDVQDFGDDKPNDNNDDN